jgi:hypothetical protein
VTTKQSRSRDAAFGFLAAIGGAALVGIFGDVEIAPVFLPLAGVLAGSIALDRTAGLTGLVVGYLVVALVWGALTVANQVESCRPDCVGLSSPSITIVLVIVVALVVEVAAIGGFVLGRLVRHVVLPGRSL